MTEIAGQVADGFADAVREHEERWLSPLAVRSYETRGRDAPEEECRLRTPFQRDRDRIVHSKAFRRLRHKTQVFVDPEGDHFRTRLTHTLEAAGIARGVARALRLNEDLTEAIAVGHDVGHPPFGHAGEEALDELLSERGRGGFRHNEHSLRVVERLERDGRGLNLTWEVRDGILKHTGPEEPETLEGRIVRLVDRFAYINHDIDDAVRAGHLDPADLPPDPIALLGDTGSRRIDTLVEDVVRLRKAGGTYKGLCPFHSERTPSFTVSPARGTFKCFGCGEGGDAISFVEKTENVDFVGAIELLARRFGVELEYEEASPEQEQKRRREDRLRALLERAAVFYTRVLWESDQGATAREYLASRGLGEKVCREFRLGYAPGGARLASRALQEGYNQEELLAVGLANRPGHDYFQRRILFPLADRNGRVRGFQARKLHDDDPLQAKYVNSPEGALFRKGDLLYGLDSAKNAIAREDRAVIVEGNTDVIALRQAEFAPVVASMGTALTEGHLRELNRLTKRLFLCFDADAAGQDATLRGMELAVAQGFDVKIVPLPPGTDPADDPTAFQGRLASPVSYPVHRVRLEHARARDKESAWAAILAFLNGLPDSPEHME